MAKVEIEQEAVPVSEVLREALKRADRVLKQLPRSARVAASIGLIAFVSTASQAKEGAIVSPVTSPAKGTETILDISQIQAEVPKVVVPSEIKTAPEYFEKALIEVEEKAPIEEVSVEQTVEFLQDLQSKVDEIFLLKDFSITTGTPGSVEKGDSRQGLIVRYPVLGKVFGQVETDLAKLQTFIDSGKQNSLEARETAKEIMEYWNTAPGENEPVKEPEIIVNPEVENSEWIIGNIRELLSFLPNSGRVVETIYIMPEGGRSNCNTYKDHGAHIYIHEYPKELARFLGIVLHELSHGAELYSKGYNLRFFTPTELIDLVLEDARIWKMEYQTHQGPVPNINEREWNAWFASDFMANWVGRGEPAAFRTLELYEARLRFVNLWLSKQLGENIDVIKIGERLGFR